MGSSDGPAAVMAKPKLPQCQTYSVVEAAAVLGVSADNLYARLREDGAVAGVRAIRLGASWRIPKAPLDALVAGEPPETDAH